MKVVSHLFVPVILLWSSLAAANTPILPKSFSGWQQDAGNVKTSNNPGDADSTNGALLKEFGFSDVEIASYSKDKDGDRKLSVKAARFSDATGAYGAYTFYSEPAMLTEKVGDLGESAGDRVLFLQGNVVVEARFEHVSAMSVAEMRELAGDIPRPDRNLAHLPDLPRYLPQPALIDHSVKYAIGPRAYDRIGPPMPVSAIDFSKSPEIVTGEYKSDSGIGKLTLISYPTPQIAGAQLRSIEQSRPNFKAADAGDFQIKRTGPILVIATGAISAAEAKSLLASVNYEAEVTYNEPTFLSKRDNIGNLIIAVFVLVGVILGFAVVIGIAFGGTRVVLKRLYPGRFFDRPEDVSVITLNLRDESPKRS